MMCDQTALIGQNTSETFNRGTVLITGSSSGIGARIAVDLASIGYSIILTGRDPVKLAKVEQECVSVSKSNGFKSKIASYQIDFFDNHQVDSLITFISSQFLKLDILINNVCWRGDKKNILENGAIDDLQQTLKMNVLLPIRLIKGCLSNVDRNHSPEQSQRNSVNIIVPRLVVINISSIAAHVAVPLHAYSISKACLSELSKQLSDIQDIVSVTISPGPVLTDERPHHIEMSHYTLLGRVGLAKEISDLVSFVTKKIHLFNGKELYIDGGYIAKQKQI